VNNTTWVYKKIYAWSGEIAEGKTFALYFFKEKSTHTHKKKLLEDLSHLRLNNQSDLLWVHPFFPPFHFSVLIHILFVFKIKKKKNKLWEKKIEMKNDSD
jgi:hypothetical protein